MTKGKHGMGLFTVDEVDAAVQALLSGGVSATDVVDGGLRGALQLAKHGALSAEAAGAIAAKTIDSLHEMHVGALAVLTAEQSTTTEYGVRRDADSACYSRGQAEATIATQRRRGLKPVLIQREVGPWAVADV